MKKALLILLLMPFVFNATAQKKPSPKKAPLHTKATAVQFNAVQMLKFFYTLYMLPYIDGSKPSELFSKQWQMRKKYCTQRCQDRYQQMVQESDDDPFIKAPGSDAAAIKSLVFTKDSKQPNKYTVTYDAGEDKINIDLNLINDKGEWKIEYIN